MTSDGLSSTDGFDSSTTMDTPLVCVPTSAHGPVVESHPSGWAAYEGCQADTYLLQREGTSPQVDPEAVDALFEDSDALLSITGAKSMFVGTCCGGDEACIRLQVNRWTLDLEQALGVAAEVFARLEPGTCLGLRLFLEGDGPRCEARDPDCGPVPACEGGAGNLCCPGPDYDPRASRTPVDNTLPAGSCAHDGDCRVTNGSCVSYLDDPPLVGRECTAALAQALCGCVEDSCRWYEQG